MTFGPQNQYILCTKFHEDKWKRKAVTVKKSVSIFHVLWPWPLDPEIDRGHPCHCRAVAMSRCRDVALSRCRVVAMSRCRVVAMSRCRDVALSTTRHRDNARWHKSATIDLCHLALSRCRVVRTRHRDTATTRHRDTATLRQREMAKISHHTDRLTRVHLILWNIRTDFKESSQEGSTKLPLPNVRMQSDSSTDIRLWFLIGIHSRVRTSLPPLS